MGATQTRGHFLPRDQHDSMREVLCCRLCISRALEANVRWSMHQLMETPEAKQAARDAHKKLVGAIFEINSGRVRFL